ncbi:RidA family protein [Rhizohabitans arisaemae]|uniref:RidA family protein n=1 Tax=Rhizohabitans arisaemae TaxID=2720610 RepID=UPI0024B1A081|nr:RidA family protein [Rhizohabitans arisaemae]
MARELFNPPQMHPATSYSHIAIARGSKQIFFAGQVALDDDLKIVGEGDLRTQALVSMRNLKLAMDAAGVGWGDIVRRTIYTTRPHALEEITSAVAEAVEGTPPPPQTIVGVTGLALPGLLIEIECTAVVDDA